MTLGARSGTAVPPWGLAVAAMLSVQLGSALSVHLISTVGSAGTAWLRLSFGEPYRLELRAAGGRCRAAAQIAHPTTPTRTYATRRQVRIPATAADAATPA
jgi:hypothetical protein